MRITNKKFFYLVYSMYVMRNTRKDGKLYINKEVKDYGRYKHYWLWRGI